MNDIGEKGGILRHGLKCLWPSEIAQQYYCEFYVHLKRLHPEIGIELAPLEVGEASHMALASQAETITLAEVEQRIRAGKTFTICEWVLEGIFQGVRIRGRPDYFAFEGKKATLVLDFKFSGAKEPFRNHEVQAQIYGLLAGSMAYSTAELCFGIVIFPPAGRGGDLREAAAAKAAMLQHLAHAGTLGKISDRCEQARKLLLASQTKKTTIESEGWKAFLYRYDEDKAARDLTWALGYWLDERGPIPVKRYPQKCFACPFNAVRLCHYALRPPDPAFMVHRSPDGRTFVSR
jgi:hypothetical protein